MKFFIKKMNTPMVTGCVDLNSFSLEFDMKLEIQSSSSKEVWDGILSAIHIFNPCVVNRIVDSQDVEYLKRNKAVFILMFFRRQKLFGKADVNSPVSRGAKYILISVHSGWAIGEACAKKQTQ